MVVAAEMLKEFLVDPSKFAATVPAAGAPAAAAAAAKEESSRRMKRTMSWDSYFVTTLDPEPKLIPLLLSVHPLSRPPALPLQKETEVPVAV